MKKLYQLTLTKRFIYLALALITISALFIRIQYVEYAMGYKPVRDAKQYVIYGYNIYSHGTFSQELSSEPRPDSYRSPGYPFFIALAFMIGGKKGFYPLVIYSQTILSALLVPLSFFIGRRFLPSSWSIFAAALVAVSPHLVSMTNDLLTEILFSFILLSATLSFYISLEKKHFFYFIVSGILFGLAYLTNETALFIPFLFAAFYLFYIKKIERKNITKNFFCNISLYLIVFLSFPAFWMWRNHNLDSNAAQGSSRAIATLSHGAYPGFIYKNEKLKYRPYLEDPRQPEFSSSLKNFSKILLERFQERPISYLSWYLFEKPYYLWSWNILQGQGDIYVYPVISSLYKIYPLANSTRILMKYLHPVILLTTLIGILIYFFKIIKKDQPVDLLNFPFVIIGYYTIIYTVFAPWPRYSVPLRPELYLFALWTVKACLTAQHSTTPDDAATSCVVETTYAPKKSF